MQGKIVIPGKSGRHRNAFLLGILGILLFSGLRPSFSQSKVAWSDYSSGIALSKKNKKNVFIFFYADWCGYCGMMDRSNFTDDGIAGFLNGNFISIRLNVDSETKIQVSNKYAMLPRELYSAMNGSALPYLVFTDSEGTIITGIPGYIKKEVFHPLLTYIHSGCYNKNVTFEEYLGGNKSCRKN